MLDIIYDPINGRAIPDGLIKGYVDKIIREALQTNVMVTVSTQCVVDEVILNMLQGTIESEQVNITHNSHAIHVDELGFTVGNIGKIRRQRAADIKKIRMTKLY